MKGQASALKSMNDNMMPVRERYGQDEEVMRESGETVLLAYVFCMNYPSILNAN